MKNLIFSISLFIPLLFYSQAGNTPKYSNEFLNIGVGARALGMSNSIVTSTDDVFSGFWNPANLTKIKSDIQI